MAIKFMRVALTVGMCATIGALLYFTGAQKNIAEAINELSEAYIGESSVVAPPPVIESLRYPASYSDLQNTDLLKLFREVSSDKYTRAFLYSDVKLRFDSTGNPVKFHPKTFDLYQRCQSAVNSDPDWAKFYYHFSNDEIRGLNSNMTRLSGIVDKMAESVGRDYVYSIVDNNLKYLMEGLDESSTKALLELTPRFSDVFPSMESAYGAALEKISKKQGDLSKQDVGMILTMYCIQVDLKLGLIGLGTNYQERVAGVVEIIKRREGQARNQEYQKRREKLNQTLDVLQKEMN